MRRRRRACVYSAVVLGAFGCAELANLDAYHSSGPQIEAAQFSVEYARIVCEGISPCCEDAGYDHDVEACKVITQNQLHYAPADPDMGYDPRAAHECLTGFGEFIRKCGLGTDASVEACDRIWRGKRPAGAPCEHHSQCAVRPGAWAACNPETGRCVDEPRGKAGDDCSFTCWDSGRGTTCVSSGRRPPEALGCASGLSSGGGDGGPGREAEPPPPERVGMARCFANDELYCSATGICDSPLPLGSKCCPLESGCARDAYCNGQTCQARVLEGGPCPKGVECEAATYCREGVCVAKQPNGFPCTDDQECRGVCGQGRCASSIWVVNSCTHIAPP